ncbi:Adaptor for signal transduction [Podila verticillata]|nr:Adaptor for signal transduction [Podila verticillata]
MKKRKPLNQALTDLDTLYNEFEENGISGDLLIHLDHAALKDLSIWEVGKRLVILKAIYQLKISYGISLEAGDYVPPSVAFENELNYQAAASLRTVEQAVHEKDNTIQHLVREVERMSKDLTKLKDELWMMQKDQKDTKAGSPGAEGAGAIKVYGQKPSSTRDPADAFRSFRISQDDPCHKVLPAALKKYKINDDWRQYALFICYGKTERILTYNEKPLLLMKQLRENNESPVFMLKHIRQMKSPAVNTPSPPSSHPPRKSSDIMNKELPLPPEVMGGSSGTSLGNGLTLNHSITNGSSLLVRSGTTASMRTSSKTSASTSTPSTPTTASTNMSGSTHHASSASGTTGMTLAPKPENYVQETVEASGTAVALYEWEAKRDDELNVKVGDVFKIKSKGHGWWVVQRDDEIGWIPASILSESSSEDGYFSAEGVAIFDFTKTGPNELSIKTGDKLKIFRRHQHWLLATCEDQRGWVPKHIAKTTHSCIPHSPTTDTYMNALEENEDAMTASFSASTFEAEETDPWTPALEPSSGAVGTILVGIPLPAIYTTAFDLAQPSGSKISVSAMNKILNVSGLSPSVLDKILNIAVPPTRSRITKAECSAALALVAMAQKNMELTIQNLIAHRQDTIRMTFAPEKEGIFIFKHTNYVVESKVLNISGAANSIQELATWRKNTVISAEDEFAGLLFMSVTLAKQIPADLELQLELIKRRLPGSVEYYRGMVHVMDRIQKRTEANAADYTRFSLALNCEQLSQGYNEIGSHISQTSLLLEEQGIAIQRGMVEDLKRHRDLLVSLMELLQRRDRNNFFSLTEALKKRIESNEIKLKNAQVSVTSGPPDVDPGQFEGLIEKLTMSVAADRDELKTQEQKAILLQHTLWTEIMYYHKNQAQVAIMYQNFVREQIKTSQSLTDNWSSLSPLVHELPMETNGFK